MKTVIVRIAFVFLVKTWTRSSQVTIFVWGRPSLSSIHQTGSYWITERKDNNRRKEGVKADGLFLPSNVHMKATILVLYQRRQLYNCAACYKSENSYRLVMEKCQVLWKFIWACYSNVRETGDTFGGGKFLNCWSAFLLVVCSKTPSVTEATERRILGLMNDELACVCVCVCVCVWKKAVVD